MVATFHIILRSPRSFIQFILTSTKSFIRRPRENSNQGASVSRKVGIIINYIMMFSTCELK